MLTNGTIYECSVAAQNAAGFGASSAFVAVTPRTVPGTPTSMGVLELDGRVEFNFSPPSNNGGSPITGYTMTCNPGATVVNTASAPVLVTGLTNGQAYNCGLTANNVAGSSAPLNYPPATPAVAPGSRLYDVVCTACHATTPTLPQLNAAGTTATVLSYAIANQPLMSMNANVTALTTAERAAIAAYLATVRPAASATTAFNTPVTIDLSSQLALGSISFETMEVAANPMSGSLSMLSGTQITFTPAAGFVGMMTFTVRGARAMPTMLQGDPITVTVTVNPPPAPVITSSLTATGTNGVMLSYQITATNSPTSYAATGLPAGLMINTMTGLISGTPTVGGSFLIDLRATNAGGNGDAVLMLTLNPAAQSITFPAQTPGTFAYAPSGNFSVNPAASASSGLAVTYTTLTPTVCTLMGGGTFIMQSAGTCTIGANQSGDANFAAAAQVTRDVTITPTLPGAPTIGAGTPGNLQATVAFSAPGNTGGVPISLYTATCTPSGTGTAMVSPIVVTGLTNGTTYTCSVRATNSVGQGSASGTVMVTPAPTPTPPTVTSANATSFTVNAPGSFSVTATGTPAVFTFSQTGALPMGVTYSTSTGVLSGTPTQAGTFPLNIVVSNGVMPNAGQSFTLTVNKANQTLSFSNPGSTAVSAGPVALVASATSGLAVSFVSDTTGVCTISGSNAVLVSVGTCTIRAQQGGSANFNAATDVTQSFMVTQGTQTITFGTQTSPRAFVAASTFMLSPVASASSALPVSYSSLTTSVCTISGTTVTMVAAGNCTIAANQAGNGNFSAAAQVTQTIVLTGSAPGAPTLNTATAGDTKITLAFTAPASNGGSAITQYTATCGAAPSVNGTGSPMVVTGLTNGMAYSCSVSATNAFGTSGTSNSMMATPVASAGSALWTSKLCGGCHGTPPTGTRLNVGGTTSTLLDYVIPLQPAMNGFYGGGSPPIPLSPAEKVAIAQYVLDNIPAVSATTPANTLVAINVGSQVSMNSPIAALTSLAIVSAPANGTIGTISGTTINYTPNMGFVGSDSFTYRATGATQTDERTVTVTVTPAAPVITSALTASGTINQAFSYQIAATNAPTSYNATGLPAGLNINTMTGVISGTPTAGGTTMVTISATGAGGTGNATLAITVNLIAQTISFPVQSTASRTFVQGGTFSISPIATGGTSGNAINYSSTTGSVCSVPSPTGTTVNILAAGICTIAANQAGNATFSAAAQVTQSVTINGTAPGAPTIGAGVAGNTQATINFTQPSNTGGLPITNYTVNCSGIIASGMASPIVVAGLMNGTTYSCSVQATNLAGTSMSSGTVMVTPVAIAFTGTVYSRKLHGAVAYDHPIANNPIATATIEPRNNAGGHQIVFVFNNPVMSATVSVTDAMGVAIPGVSATAGYNANELIVTITNLADAMRVNVNATGVNGALTVSRPVAFLIGDVTQSGRVTAADIAAVKARISLPISLNNNHLFDLTLSGGISSADVNQVKGKSGNVLP
jgi:mono/diheme cytochrome c family protein